MNQELQTLLDKVDANFRHTYNELPCNNTILGKVYDFPARLTLKFKLGGAYSQYKPQVIFSLVIQDKAVATWGCIGDNDTEQLVRWWYDKQEVARDGYMDAHELPQRLWDNL